MKFGKMLKKTLLREGKNFLEVESRRPPQIGISSNFSSFGVDNIPWKGDTKHNFLKDIRTQMPP